jgi:Fis family transcriptional regulator
MTLQAQSALKQEHVADKDTKAGSLRAHIKAMLEDYFRDLDGHQTAGLYQLVLEQVEQPLLETVLTYTRGNQSKAAELLGLNRGTLRKKLKQYDIN